MKQQRQECLDGNEAAARIAYALSEVIAIYPITPASPMGEHCRRLVGRRPAEPVGQGPRRRRDAVRGRRRRRAARRAPEGRAGDDVHGVAGPAADDPQHVQDRRRADAGGDPRRGPDDRHARAVDLRRPQRRDARPHDRLGDARAPARSRRRTTSRSVAHAATLRARVPFLHFFDGFRTVARDRQDRACSTTTTSGRSSATTTSSAFRRAGLTPDAPVVRGTAQNPDVFFQAREACEPVPPRRARHRRRRSWTSSPTRTGRRYGLVDYHGAPDAERVIVADGLGGRRRRGDGRHAGARPASGSACSRLRLFQPFPSRGRSWPRCRRRCGRSPCSTAPRSRAPSASRSTSRSSPRSPRRWTSDAPPFATMPRVIGGRYGLSSKEFTPSMVKPIFDELAAPRPKRHFTVGIYDDVTHLSLPIDADVPSAAAGRRGPGRVLRARLGRHGRAPTRRRSRSSARAPTCSPRATSSTTRRSRARSRCRTCASGRSRSARRTSIDDADFVACHQFGLLDRIKVLDHARARARRSCSTRRTRPTRSGSTCPTEVQRQIVDKAHRLLGHRRDRGRAPRPGWAAASTPSCSRASSSSRASCPPDEAIARIKGFVEKTYAQARRRGRRSATSPPSTARSPRLSKVTPGRIAADRPTVPAIAGRRAGLRHPGHRPADRRRGRPAPRQRAAGRRHVPHRHGAVREAGDRPEDPDLGSRPSASTAASARSSARTPRSA